MDTWEVSINRFESWQFYRTEEKQASITRERHGSTSTETGRLITPKGGRYRGHAGIIPQQA